MGLEKWKIEIDEYIPKLLDSEVNEKNSNLLASLVTLQNYIKRVGFSSETSSKSDDDAISSNLSEGWLVRQIDGELNDADGYYNIYASTKDKTFKNIALDELRHMESLIKILKKSYPEHNIDEMKIMHHAMLAKLI